MSLARRVRDQDRRQRGPKVYSLHLQLPHPAQVVEPPVAKNPDRQTGDVRSSTRLVRTPVKNSQIRPAFGLPEALVAVHTSRFSCGKAGKTRIYTPIRASSGKSQLSCHFRPTYDQCHHPLLQRIVDLADDG
jgi:hypothetical protein